MPDDLDRFLAEQEAAELAEWDKHIDHRHELRSRQAQRQPSRNRTAVVDELEAGSDEIAAIDNAIRSKQNDPT